jgi:hypothetical protein
MSSNVGGPVASMRQFKRKRRRVERIRPIRDGELRTDGEADYACDLGSIGDRTGGVEGTGECGSMGDDRQLSDSQPG